MLINEIMHTIKACSDFGYVINKAGYRITSLINLHRENGTDIDDPIILHTGIKSSDFPDETMQLFYGLAELLGTSYFHNSFDKSVFLIGSEQETKTVMKSWEYLNRCFNDYKERFYRGNGTLSQTYELFLSEVERFPVILPTSSAIKQILLSGAFDLPPARMLEYDEHETIPDAIPSDVYASSLIEFCFKKKFQPRMKYRSYGSLFHQDNSRQISVITFGEVNKKADRVKYVDDGKTCTRSLDRVYIRDVSCGRTDGTGERGKRND